MNYKLELNTQEPNSKIVFNTILFDSFKINIVERYIGSMRSRPTLCEALFKVRTLDDVLVARRDGNTRVKIKGDEFETYQRLIRDLSSYEYKNRLINRKDVEQNYVHFVLSLVIANYDLN
ncbi:prevent-host-death protein [Chryseobacterium lactis]|uniref:Prevent-host-death protein n=1 Tax=Chryseobacterium lactis TaxID=1241981 RepID=A0A3G6RHV6_CHRLC|nr:prevent-host-death protein [Chryseobacterium lactis]AZA84145.1 prevent-host-death protein [Chryseobacterium lactis]AZB04531.1 prevent-host-death protein [Chryseobacterium lactis]PNW12700.1 prevent-host-death protein [Chryseobacterium lactis]